MKILSKINRGAILTTGVILVVIAYLIVHSALQNMEKPEIKKICEAYIQKEISYNMLPADYRKVKPAMPEAALEKYLKSMKTDIIAFYPSNEQYYKFIIQSITTDLTNQAKGTGVVFSYAKTILRYDDLNFDGDTVDVRFTSNSTMEVQSQSGIASSIKEKIAGEIQDNVILQKIDGKWKVVYSSITRPTGNNYPGGDGPIPAIGKY